MDRAPMLGVPPLSVHAIPPSDIERFHKMMFAMIFLGIIVVSVVFFTIGLTQIPEGDPMKPVMMYYIPAFEIVSQLPGYFILRAVIRKRCRRDARYELYPDRLVRLFPPVMTRVVFRDEVERVDEWSPHGPLVLTLKRGRTFKVPGDIERYDELKGLLLSW